MNSTLRWLTRCLPLIVFTTAARADSPSWVSEALRAIPILDLGKPETPAQADSPPEGYAKPHPAVARIVVPETDGTTYGSGTLVDARGEYGLVVTNWHVVETARQELWVEFADGFRSAGKLLKVDRDWDLAAIAIWRPRSEPVALAKVAPRPGDELVIAGYGNGPFRAARGQCLQYVTPSLELPLEMVQVSAAARNGDSGGPIFNDRGELAGVLFGTGEGVTSGSYCGRVNEFLASVLPKEAPRHSGTVLSQGDLFSSTSQTGPPNATNSQLTGGAVEPQATEVTSHAPPATVQDFGLLDAVHAPPAAAAEPVATLEVDRPPTTEIAPDAASAASPPEFTSEPASPTPDDGIQDSERTTPPEKSEVDWLALAGDNAAERVKTALAILGGCTLIWHTVRLLSGARAPAANSQA